MKAVILAGGLGTRFSEETGLRPKPMIEIGGMPILWHIMKIYAHHGVSEFVICLGYKGEIIKSYFLNYANMKADITVDMSTREVAVRQSTVEDWTVHLVDTGKQTMTGGRIKAVGAYVSDAPFHMTYGDGVADVDIGALTRFHERHGKIATVTAVTPPGRFGVLDIDGDAVTGFREKIASDQYKINAGFFVLAPKVLDYIEAPDTIWEQQPMLRLAQTRELMAFKHDGFWQPMDTLRDKLHLEGRIETGRADWMVWE